MKLRMHHIELCVSDPNPVAKLLSNQLGLPFVGYRETAQCLQLIFKMEQAVFIVTTRNVVNPSETCNGTTDINNGNNHKYPDIVFESGTLSKSNSEQLTRDPNETWTLFCCDNDTSSHRDGEHVDSVFNVAIQVEDLQESVNRIRSISNALVLQDIKRAYDSNSELGYVDYAVIKSCCGNVVHTLVEKSGYGGWFLPGFYKANREGVSVKSPKTRENCGIISMTHFDHFTLVCRVGGSNEIMDWYERAFGMKRFITNSDETEQDGLVIGDDVGLRLKVMQFWKCSESGLASDVYGDGESEPLKIVIAESLPNLSNTQIEGFIKDHGGPGIQHVGLHTNNMIRTVEIMTGNGVKFRQPPPTYYTEIGQLEVIKSVGENVEALRKYGILLDNEADVFDNLENAKMEERYLMQIFTHPVFPRDTFFLEVIQRKGARGFGVGNVTALARSVNAYNQAKLKMEEEENGKDCKLNRKCNGETLSIYKQ